MEMNSYGKPINEASPGGPPGQIQLRPPELRLGRNGVSIREDQNKGNPFYEEFWKKGPTNIVPHFYMKWPKLSPLIPKKEGNREF